MPTPVSSHEIFTPIDVTPPYYDLHAARHMAITDSAGASLDNDQPTIA